MSRDADTLNAKCSLGSWSPRARLCERSRPKKGVRHGLWKGLANSTKASLRALDVC